MKIAFTGRHSEKENYRNPVIDMTQCTPTVIHSPFVIGRNSLTSSTPSASFTSRYRHTFISRQSNLIFTLPAIDWMNTVLVCYRNLSINRSIYRTWHWIALNLDHDPQIGVRLHLDNPQQMSSGSLDEQTVLGRNQLENRAHLKHERWIKIKDALIISLLETTERVEGVRSNHLLPSNCTPGWMITPRNGNVTWNFERDLTETPAVRAKWRGKRWSLSIAHFAAKPSN